MDGPSHSSQKRFTITGVIVTSICVLLVISISLPALQRIRESARQSACKGNLKDIGLAIHNYHSAFSQIPQHGTGPTNEANDDCCGDATKPGRFPETPAYSRHQLSAFVSILPFLDQQSLWEQISNPMLDSKDNHWPAFGPAPYTVSYDPWVTEVSNYRCPSDPGFGYPAMGRTNYAVCTGDTAWRTDDASWSYFKGSGWRYNGSNRHRREEVEYAVRGFFVPRRALDFDDIKDGMSNTIAAGEICTGSAENDIRTSGSVNNGNENVLGNPSYCRDQGQLSPLVPNRWSDGSDGATRPNLTSNIARRGYRWADFRPLYTQFNTILPPNSEICMRATSRQDAVASMSSNHEGGAHMLMGDGAVIFLTDSIESGDVRSPMIYRRDKDSEDGRRGISPYGLWGALGTRDSNETIEESA